MATRKDHSTSGGLIAGAGGAAATGGLVGGGIPGFKANSDTIKDIKQGSWKKRTGAALSSGRGGVFGYRTNAHQGANQRFKDSAAYFKDKPATRVEMYQRGQNAGKVPAEEKIIRHMKTGRRLSTAALAGGVAATTYGIHRAKSGEVKKNERHTKQYNSTLLGAGSTVAAASYGGEKFMERQGNKWGNQASRSISHAQKIVPNLGGSVVNPLGASKVPNLKVPDVGPAVNSSKIKNDKKILAGKSKLQAEAAGLHRGDAAQARYFAGVYGKTAKTVRRLRTPALAAAGAGATGLLVARDKRKVSKKRNMSDAEIRRRQKLQSKIGRTTSTLGLTGLGLTGVAAAASKKPGMLKAIPKLRDAKPAQLKNAAINTGIVSGGIGGAGGFNQAAVYSAESRRRRPAAVSKGVPVEMGYYGEAGAPLSSQEIEKAWAPVSSGYDAESKRHKRADAYGNAALAGAGAGAAVAAHQGTKAVQAGLKLNGGAELKTLADKGGVLRRAGGAGAGLAAVGAGLAARKGIERGKKKSWQSYD